MRICGFDGGHADIQFVEHHQRDAGMDQHDAGPLLERQHAAGQQHQSRRSRLAPIATESASTNCRARNRCGREASRVSSFHDRRDGRASRVRAGGSNRASPGSRPSPPRSAARPELHAVPEHRRQIDQLIDGPWITHHVTPITPPRYGQAGQQPLAARLNLESQPMGREQIDDQQAADQPAAGKRKSARERARCAERRSGNRSR